MAMHHDTGYKEWFTLPPPRLSKLCLRGLFRAL